MNPTTSTTPSPRDLHSAAAEVASYNAPRFFVISSGAVAGIFETRRAAVQAAEKLQREHSKQHIVARAVLSVDACPQGIGYFLWRDERIDV